MKARYALIETFVFLGILYASNVAIMMIMLSPFDLPTPLIAWMFAACSAAYTWFWAYVADEVPAHRMRHPELAGYFPLFNMLPNVVSELSERANVRVAWRLILLCFTPFLTPWIALLHVALAIDVLIGICRFGGSSLICMKIMMVLTVLLSMFATPIWGWRAIACGVAVGFALIVVGMVLGPAGRRNKRRYTS
jgi:hypothetical protein